jgi:hypothetical protein
VYAIMLGLKNVFSEITSFRKFYQSLHWTVCASFLQTYGALFCETSAKDGSNVVEAVLHLAR